MWQTAQDTYLEDKILSASPIGLVRLLYQGAMNAVREARRQLEAGRIRERAQAISNACDILAELTLSLDHSRGGELSRRLAAIYDYMLRRLTEANLKQTPGPLDEVFGLLATLADAWNRLGADEPAPRPWAPPAPQEAACCSQSWSF
jgi:flagellar protein FliS